MSPATEPPVPAVACCVRCGETTGVTSGMCDDELLCDIRWLTLGWWLEWLYGWKMRPLLDFTRVEGA